ncbi:MAG: hypothetical protein H6683_05480 [Deltaproteobacteria bacterium]|nr:hypothetical protein [Deltaproteobacteria bacterium]
MKLTQTMLIALLSILMLTLIVNCGSSGNDESEKTDDDESVDDDADDDDDDADSTLTFNPDDFQTLVDNAYFPLTPGVVKTFEGEEDGEEVLVYTRVHDETVMVAGVPCTLLEEEEYTDGELAEISRNWFAQETSTGDVYYFGEDVDEYEDGEIVGHDGAWKVGEGDVSEPGKIFPGDPKLGDVFHPEAAPDEAEEQAEIIETGLDYSAPYADFSDVIKVQETDLLSGGKGWKYYAPGVGLVAEEYEDGDMPLVDLAK